jgi:hypothetical protein
LFGIWLAGALAVLAALATALLRARWQRRLARPIMDPAWTGLLDRVRAELNVRRPVELVAGDDQAMPMTWGWRRPVVLLPAGAEDWPEPRRQTVLLHELAHVTRGDYLAQLAAEVVRALYWFNPLVWMAARKLRLESEHACDDRVLAAGSRASDYAGDLLDIARSLRAIRAAGLAMARPSQLAGRLTAVLDAGRSRRGISRRLAVPAWLGAAFVVLPLAALTPAVAPLGEIRIGGFTDETGTASVSPARESQPPRVAARPTAASTVLDRNAPPTPPNPPAPPKPAKPGRTSVHHNSTDGVETFEWSHNRDGHRIKIRMEGEFELTEDWTGIARLSRGAEMRFEEDDGRTERRLDVEPGDDGRPVYTWKVDGQERPFDAEGRRWLQDMLLQFVRSSGYKADERVAWILQRQGPEGVLAEISQIPGDYGKRIYFEKLFGHRNLGAAVVERAVRQAGKEIAGDYDLAQALTAAAGSQPMTEPITLAYVEAARSLDGDYDQRRTLTEILDKGRFSPPSLTALLRSAHQIDSDYDLAELLVAVAGKNALDDAAVQRAYVEAADKVGSDYDRRRALAAAVQRGNVSQETLISVLRSARGIDSSHERATLLIEIAGRHSLSGAAREAYLEAARSIDSDYDRKRAEAALGR